MPRHRLIALLAGLSCAAATHAATVFSDNFDANVLGLNSVPAGWSVSAGTVDIIGSTASGALFDLLPGHGAYIDLDGSTFASGLLSVGLSLTAGVEYTATFDLAGSQRGTAETGTVSFGSAGLSYALASADPFASLSLSFTPSTSGNFTLSFQNEGGDNLGALLDNVTVTSEGSPTPIPEPQTYALMLAGLALVAGAARGRGRAR
jgi:hypothetical protein